MPSLYFHDPPLRRRSVLGSIIQFATHGLTRLDGRHVMTIDHLQETARAAREMVRAPRLAQRDDGIRLNPDDLIVRPGQLHQSRNQPP